MDCIQPLDYEVTDTLVLNLATLSIETVEQRTAARLLLLFSITIASWLLLSGRLLAVTEFLESALHLI